MRQHSPRAFSAKQRNSDPKFPYVPLLIVCLSLPCSAAPPTQAGSPLESARIREIALLLPAKPAGFGSPISDRVTWESLARNPTFAQVISNAEGMLSKPVPALPDDLYLDYSRTGNRDRCQKVLFERAGRLSTLALAEALEQRGRFIQPLKETISALCLERTWVYPAHDGKLNNFYGRTVEMDLRATAVAWDLATVDHLLGDKLAPETRRLIRENVSRRVLQPFRDMVEQRRPEIYWMRATHNWNAVCLAGVTGAALALLDDPQERAWHIAAAEYYIRFFLSGFTPDGYCSEGVGYWNYGFGHFIMLGEAIRQATTNRVDLLADPGAFQPALYSLHAEILNGIFPTISDCHPGSRPDPQMVRYICERFGLDRPAADQADFVKVSGGLVPTLMFSFLPSRLPVIHRGTVVAESPLRTWFKDGGVLICRSTAGATFPFGAVLKGGNNAEHHNHNDVGSFSIVAGKAMVICDPGSEVYTARTFSSHRYDSKVLSSYGHAVPRVAGQLQHAGADARAIVLRADFTDQADTLALDLRSAYKVPELEKLERTFVFQREDQTTLSVRDEVSFTAPSSFETALITWGKWKNISPTELQIEDEGGAVRVRIDTGGKAFEMQSETLDEDVPTKKKPVRISIALKSPVKGAMVTMTFRAVATK